MLDIYHRIIHILFERLLLDLSICHWHNDAIWNTPWPCQATTSPLCTVGKRNKFSAKPVQYFSPHLKTGHTLPWKN